MSKYMLRLHKKVTWYNVKRVNVVPWNNKRRDFPKSITNMGDFGRQFKKLLLYHKSRRLTANTGEMECMTWNVMRKHFYIYLSYCKKYFRNLSYCFAIFRNPFHCKCNEVIIFLMVCFLLHCPLYFVFLCVCNVNFEEIFLYSIMSNP